MNLERGRMAVFLLAAHLMLLTACDGRAQTETGGEQPGYSEAGESRQEADTEESNPRQGQFFENPEDTSEYFQAYQEFLLYTDIDQGSDFPIWGYYLFDMNFDGVPELGVLHDSGGSMGGYFTFYRFDGKEIVPAVLDEKGSPRQISNYTRILADRDREKMFLLKEMYLLRGNYNGTYGYLSEITDDNGVLYCVDRLRLNVDCDDETMIDSEMHNCEDEFLRDKALAQCLIAEIYANGEWETIRPEEYLTKKREWIPEDNLFTDIRDTEVYILMVDSVYDLMEEEGKYRNRQMTEEEVDILFAKWAAQQGERN